MWWLLLFIIFPVWGGDGPEKNKVERYNLTRLSESDNSELLRTMDDPNKLVRANTEVFLDYVRRNSLFVDDDEIDLPAIIKKVRKEGNGIFDSLSRSVIREWHRNHTPPPSPEPSFAKASDDESSEPLSLLVPVQGERKLNVFLLERLKNEQQIQLAFMRNKHEEALQAKRFEQNKFYATTCVALVTTIISLIEAFFLLKGKS